MNDIVTLLNFILLIINVGLLVLILTKLKKMGSIDLSTLQQINYKQERLEGILRDELGKNRQELTFNTKVLREELALQLHNFTNANDQKIIRLTQMNEQKLDKLRETVESKLASIQTDNNKKLEEMRVTVDEKLHSTLEKRLGESFQLVSERLEQVHKGLGEMQQLATGVGDLKKFYPMLKHVVFGERCSWRLC